MIISNESMNFKDPKESDDPQLFDDPSSCYSMIHRYSMIPSYSMINGIWTLIIEKSTVIPPSLMVLLSLKFESPVLKLYTLFCNPYPPCSSFSSLAGSQTVETNFQKTTPPQFQSFF